MTCHKFSPRQNEIAIHPYTRLQQAKVGNKYLHRTVVAICPMQFYSPHIDTYLKKKLARGTNSSIHIPSVSFYLSKDLHPSHWGKFAHFAFFNMYNSLIIIIFKYSQKTPKRRIIYNRVSTYVRGLEFYFHLIKHSPKLVCECLYCWVEHLK